MTDDRDLEAGLRRVLRDQSRRVQDTSLALPALYAGAARRRARRRAATAVAGASAFVLVVAGFSTWHVLATTGPTHHIAAGPVTTADTSPATATASSSQSATATSPRPASTSPTATVLAVPAGFQALSVTAISSSHWWVLGTDGLVATTTDGGHTFALTGLPGLGVRARTVRFANGSDGWAVTAASGSGQQQTLWATVDGGRTWTAVRGLDGVASAVEASHGWVFALTGRSDGTWSVWAAPVGASTWHRIGNVGVVVSSQTPLLAAQNGHAIVVASNTDRVRAWLVNPDGSSTQLATPCTPDVGTGDLSASTSSVWLVCHQGTADALYRSSDGSTWTAVPGASPVAGRLRVGAIDSLHAAVGLADGTIREVSVTSSTAGSVSGSHQGGWDYIAFTTPSDGFAIDNDGALLRTVDGGATWAQVSYR